MESGLIVLIMSCSDAFVLDIAMLNQIPVLAMLFFSAARDGPVFSVYIQE